MASGWLKEEIKDVKEEVRNWPEWKKAMAGDKQDNQQTQQSSSIRNTSSNSSSSK
jgi:hypothetical protein